MPHILIVEDEPSMSWALAEGLSEDGFTTDTFPTADMQLPGMSGLDLARKLQRGPHAQPVIIVTAYGTPETLRELRRAGVADCFPKPFPIDMLRRSVRRALESGAELKRGRKRGAA